MFLNKKARAFRAFLLASININPTYPFIKIKHYSHANHGAILLAL